jgi:hypothetical protein
MTSTTSVVSAPVGVVFDLLTKGERPGWSAFGRHGKRFAPYFPLHRGRRRVNFPVFPSCRKGVPGRIIAPSYLLPVSFRASAKIVKFRESWSLSAGWSDRYCTPIIADEEPPAKVFFDFSFFSA